MVGKLTKALLVPVTIALGCSACSSSDGGGDSSDEIKIGVTAPLSGALAASGRDTVDAIKLGAEQFNREGGINGRKVKIIAQDDQCDAQAGTQAAQKLVQQGVVAIVGGYCSSATIPEVGVLQRSGGLPFIAGLSSSPDLTSKGYENVFRVASRDDRQGPAIAQYVSQVLGAKKLAIVTDGTTYSVSLGNATKKAAESLGLDVVYDDALTPGKKDYTSILTKVSTTDADAMAFTGQYPEFGLLLKQWDSLDLPFKLVGNDADANEAILPTAGDAAKDKDVSFVSTPNGNVVKTDSAKKFVAEFKAKYGRAPDAFAIASYDSMKTMAAALKDSDGKTGSKDLLKALRGVHLEGITGAISFDDKGDRPTLDFYSLRVSGDPAAFVGVQVFDGSDWAPIPN